MPLDGGRIPRFQDGIMKPRGFPLLFALLLLPGCDEKSSPEARKGPDGKAKASGFSGFGDDDSVASGKTKSSDRPTRTNRPPVAEPVPGQPGKVISPFSGEIVDVSASFAGDLVEDPKYPGDETKKFTVPVFPNEAGSAAPLPVANLVPGKDGMVISPYSNKLVDVRGIPGGTLVADPTFPASEKKYFRVPVTFDPGNPPPIDAEEPGASEEGTQPATPPEAKVEEPQQEPEGDPGDH